MDNIAESVGMEKPFFSRDITQILKGIAILLMLALHLLRPEWMTYPELVIGVPIKDSYLYAILSNGGDICIGIFAFISGYGWSSSFNKKSLIERIGGVYSVYWFILIIFAFPMRILFKSIIGNESLQLDAKEVILSVLAISSESVRFQWYIYFFALAVLSYTPIRNLLDKVRIGAVVKIYIVCIMFIVIRIGSRIVFTRIIPSNLVLGVLSHYCQWMPVVLAGHVTARDKLFDKLYDSFRKKLSYSMMFILSLLMAIIIYCGKCFGQFFTGIYSNYDSFIILPLMFLLCIIARCINEKHMHLRAALSFLGGISMYLWLTHNVMLYHEVQWILLHARFPLLIILVAVFVLSPVALLIQKIYKMLFIVRKK